MLFSTGMRLVKNNLNSTPTLFRPGPHSLTRAYRLAGRRVVKEDKLLISHTNFRNETELSLLSHTCSHISQ
jgi:hypothetical protein